MGQFVDGAVDAANTGSATATPKCLTRQCIEGLEEALKWIHADDLSSRAAAEMPYSEVDANAIQQMLRQPKPTLLRSAAKDWGPTNRWTAEHLKSSAGNEELEVTVVTMDGSFEVRSDRIERPPKSVMRLGDFVRLLAAKIDANLTIYSRQAPLCQWRLACRSGPT